MNTEAKVSYRHIIGCIAFYPVAYIVWQLFNFIRLSIGRDVSFEFGYLWIGYAYSIACSNIEFWSVLAVSSFLAWIRVFVSRNLKELLYANAIWAGLVLWPLTLSFMGIIRYCGP